MLRKKFPRLIWSVLGSVWAHLSIAHPVAAQIVPDATLPVNSIVTPQENTYLIEGGTQAGGNLFHSFSQFSVPTGTEAFFNNTVEIKNIFSRVTGSDLSNIDGLIRANGVANLFLINPNGIIFGPNARLNIGGSFLASVASSIKFGDRIEFSANNPNPSSLLTITIPVGLQFGSNPGPIAVNGPGHNLSANPQTGKISRNNRNSGLQVFGQTLALVGGGVTLAGGNLTAEAGNIELGSVGAGSLVTIAPVPTVNGNSWTLSYENVQNFQDINLVQAASLDASGSKGGSIQVQGRRVTLTEGSAILADTLGNKTGGNLIINASEAVEAIGSSIDGKFSSGLFADTYSTGKGGNLTVNTASLLLQNGAVVRANTFGAGQAGNLTVNASEQVQAIGVSADAMRPSAFFARADRGSSGDAGDLIINTARLLLQDGGQVGAGTLGSGRGGNLTINASEQVEVRGISADSQFPSALGSRAAINSTGDAGNLTINTGLLVVADRARVGARGLGEGNAGIVTINARSIWLDNQGFISTDSQSVNTDSNREQATINLSSGTLILRQNSSISTNAEGKNAIGGNINIASDAIVALGNSDISANSKNSRGGQVRINSQGIFGSQFQLEPTGNSDITASGGTSELTGSVEINAPSVEPTSGLVKLSVNFTDISEQIATACTTGQSNNFTVTGRGGLPSDPTQPLVAWTVWRDLRPVEVGNRASFSGSVIGNSRSPTPMIEAQGWTIDSQGRVELIAEANALVPNSLNLRSPYCQTP